MQTSQGALRWAWAAGVCLLACSVDSAETGTSSGASTATSATSGGAAGASQSASSSSASTGAGGSNSGSSTASATSAGGSSTTGSTGGSSGPTGGSAGSAGSVPDLDASVDASGARDGSVSDRSVADGVAGPDGTAVAGCDQNNYAVCLDFEKGMDPKWTGIGTNVQMGKAAHGTAAFHGPPNSMLTTTQLGSITNVIWGRLYLHMAPGAPVGHGELVGVYDQANNWYELGFEFNGLQGNWHGNGGEKYMRTKTKIPDAYACIEFLFDGATPAVAKIWQDGQEIQYYDVSTVQGPNKVTQFRRIEVGFRPFHSLSLTSYDGNNPPLMTDMWIDDIAFDTKRIGCIAP